MQNYQYIICTASKCLSVQTPNVISHNGGGHCLFSDCTLYIGIEPKVNALLRVAGVSYYAC